MLTTKFVHVFSRRGLVEVFSRFFEVKFRFGLQRIMNLHQLQLPENYKTPKNQEIVQAGGGHTLNDSLLEKNKVDVELSN